MTPGEKQIQEAVFEIDSDCGQLRIIVNHKESEWVHYEHLAHLEYDGRHFIGASQYFSGVLPTERVLEVKSIEKSVSRNLNRKSGHIIEFDPVD